MKPWQQEIISLSAISSPPLPSLLAGSAAWDGSRHATAHRAHGPSWADGHAPSSWHISGMGLRMLHHLQKCSCPPQPGKRALPFPGTPGLGKPSQHYTVYLPFAMLQNCLDLFSKGFSLSPQNMAADVLGGGLGGQGALRALRAPAERLAEEEESL